MPLVDLAILVLAAFRLTNFIQDDSESGPFALFARVRHLLGWRYDELGREFVEGRFKIQVTIGEATQCFWCLSVYTGLILAVLYFFFPDIVPWLLLPFAISGGAIIAKKATK